MLWQGTRSGIRSGSGLGDGLDCGLGRVLNGFWADYGQGFWDRGLSLIFGFWVRISMVNEDENRGGFQGRD